MLYVNLGSTVKDSTLPKEKLNSFLDTFAKIPLRILWKWDSDEEVDLPSNVMTMKWLPQYDILSKFVMFRVITLVVVCYVNNIVSSLGR